MPGPYFRGALYAPNSIAHDIIRLVFIFALLALVAAAIYALVRYVESTRSTSPTPAASAPSPSEETPESVLRMRLARGEIDEEEYRSKMSVLTSA